MKFCSWDGKKRVRVGVRLLAGGVW